MGGWLLSVVNASLAAVFVVSGVGKFLTGSSVRQALRATGFGDRLASVAVAGLPVAEIAIAAGIVIGTPRTVRFALLGAALLFTAFTIWIVATLARGKAVACGCFGPSTHAITWWTAARNFLLVAAAVVTFAAARTVDTPVIPPRPEGFALVAGAVLIVALASAYRMAKPTLTLAWADVEKIHPRKEDTP